MERPVTAGCGRTRRRSASAQGESASGGDLAAGAALKLHDDGQPPAQLIFVYGVAHSVIPPMSADGLVWALQRRALRWRREFTR